MIGKKLLLANDKKVIKMFPGEDVHWQLIVANESAIPVVHGELYLKIGSSVAAETHGMKIDAFWNQSTVPLSLGRNSESVIHISVKAIERGVAMVDEITLTYPHLFNFKNILLVFRKLYQTEFIVYPTPLPVHGMKSVLEMISGNHNMNISPFEDILNLHAVRDYQYRDPFHRINWPATLKTGTLKTNEYAKVIQLSYVLVVNLQSADDSDMVCYHQHIEKIISYVAYICRTATEEDIAYSVYVNVRKKGKTPFVHLLEGKGKIHYAQTMEILARIHKQPITIPLEQMLYCMSPELIHANVVVLIGDITDTAKRTLQQWHQRKMTVLHVTEEGGAAVMTQIG